MDAPRKNDPMDTVDPSKWQKTPHPGMDDPEPDYFKEPAVSAQTPTFIPHGERCHADDGRGSDFGQCAEAATTIVEHEGQRRYVCAFHFKHFTPPTTATPTTAERVSLFDRIQEAKTITLSKCDNAGCNQNHPCRSCELILNTLNTASIHATAAGAKIAELDSQLTALQEAVAQVRAFATSGRDLRGFGPENHWRIGYREACSDILSRLPASPVETPKESK